ncbi:hypothetical protein Mapa_001854 [Marchantia paleacea]|nr:hypothetical protein Mapa_001854 [Marchantia paleacea]
MSWNRKLKYLKILKLTSHLCHNVECTRCLRTEKITRTIFRLGTKGDKNLQNTSIPPHFYFNTKKWSCDYQAAVIFPLLNWIKRTCTARLLKPWLRSGCSHNAVF